MHYIIQVQHNRPIERILYDHENETTKLRLTDISDWIFSRQKFYRRGEHCISCLHWANNIAWILLTIACAVLVYLDKSFLAQAI